MQWGASLSDRLLQSWSSENRPLRLEAEPLCVGEATFPTGTVNMGSQYDQSWEYEDV